MSEVWEVLSSVALTMLILSPWFAYMGWRIDHPRTTARDRQREQDKLWNSLTPEDRMWFRENGIRGPGPLGDWRVDAE